MEKPPLYAQTDLQAFATIKTKFDGLKTQSAELTAIWEKATKDIQQVQDAFRASKEAHQKFDKTVEEIKEEANASMNTVRFSSSENLETLSMPTIKEQV